MIVYVYTHTLNHTLSYTLTYCIYIYTAHTTTNNHGHRPVPPVAPVFWLLRGEARIARASTGVQDLGGDRHRWGECKGNANYFGIVLGFNILIQHMVSVGFGMKTHGFDTQAYFLLVSRCLECISCKIWLCCIGFG